MAEVATQVSGQYKIDIHTCDEMENTHIFKPAVMLFICLFSLFAPFILYTCPAFSHQFQCLFSCALVDPETDKFLIYSRHLYALCTK